MPMPGCRVAGVLVAATLLTACGEPTDASAAAMSAGTFVDAVAAGRGAAACAQLTERARRAIEAFGRDCAQAIVTLPPAGPRTGEVELWSDNAQVRYANDVLFMARFDDGWKVRAAGCRPRPGQPYECAVAG
jgi:hypothetical protein